MISFGRVHEVMLPKEPYVHRSPMSIDQIADGLVSFDLIMLHIGVSAPCVPPPASLGLFLGALMFPLKFLAEHGISHYRCLVVACSSADDGLVVIATAPVGGRIRG